MRRAVILSAMVVGALAASAVAADPVPAPKLYPPPTSPDPMKLRTDTAALAKERDDAAKAVRSTATAAERAVLRAQLTELLKRINDRPPGSPYPKAPSPKPFVLPEGARPLDSLRLAENLFKEGEIDASLRAFRLIDTTALSREDRAFVQYMTACCLRKMNKRAEAAVIYREVADAREDEVIAGYAVSQLSLIRSTEELEAQLEQLRSRPKSR